MKGVVFTEFLAMVDEEFSPRVTDTIVTAADLRSGGAYTAVGTYPAGEMGSLVTALSAEVDVPPADLLRAFGMRLFTRFTEMYPSFFPADLTLTDFLAQVDAVIHTEVRKLYPDAETPAVTVAAETHDVLLVTYRSPRDLPDLAEGLLQGAIDHFGVPYALTRLPSADGPSTAVFRLANASAHA